VVGTDEARGDHPVYLRAQRREEALDVQDAARLGVDA